MIVKENRPTGRLVRGIRRNPSGESTFDGPCLVQMYVARASNRLAAKQPADTGVLHLYGEDTSMPHKTNKMAAATTRVSCIYGNMVWLLGLLTTSAMS